MLFFYCFSLTTLSNYNVAAEVLEVTVGVVLTVVVVVVDGNGGGGIW